MDIFSAFATDEKLENEGKWFPLSKTASVKVARKNNEAYKLHLSRVFKEDPLQGIPEKEANKMAEAILLEASASTILLDWKGLKFKGEDLPVSVENAKVLLAVKDFREKIDSMSGNFEAYRLKAEEDQKNA